MGYTVYGSATLQVRTGEHAAALARMKEWAIEHTGGDGYLAWTDMNQLANADTLHDVWAAMGFDSYGEGDTIKISYGDSWSQDYDAAADTLRPFLDLTESFSEWTGEEGEVWTWTHPTDPERYTVKVWNGPELRAAYDAYRKAAAADSADALDAAEELTAQVAHALNITPAEVTP